MMLASETRVLNRLRTFIIEQKGIPWTVSNRFRLWLEYRAREHWPALYRLVHCGRLRDIVRPLTSGPEHHFFGYYDKSPWNRSETLLLAHEVSFNDRPPGPSDRATIGIVHLNEGNQFEPVAKTPAWNWQQGAMLQWDPGAPEDRILYNDRRDGRFVGVRRSLRDGEERVYQRPFYALTPTGSHALSLNFSRLYDKRPGYGYAGVKDAYANEDHPAKDGIFCMDMGTGETVQIISLDALAHRDRTPDMQDVPHWVNHVQASPDGRRFAFLHRWRAHAKGWRTRLYTAKLDGSELHCCLDAGTISHYDWLDGGKILVWAKTERFGDAFVLCDATSGPVRPFAVGVVEEDGHCSFSPDRQWVLNDTYPDRFHMRTLMLIRFEDEKRVDLARLFAPLELSGEIRCDLHPRWCRTGRQVCFDSAHEGGRQMYVFNLDGIV